MQGKKITVVGGGRLGKSLAFQLQAHSHEIVGIACSNAISGAQAAELTGTACGAATELAAAANIIFITTPDNMLEAVCNQLASSGAIGAKTIVLHCSGSKPSSILHAAKDCGAQIASMHPLQSFSGFNKDVNPFLNVNFTLEGDFEAVETAKALALDLGAAHCYTIDTAGKVLYHAAAVMSSNYLVTLFYAAADLLSKTGITKDEAFTVLAPLLNGTLKNLADNAPFYEMALTGPIARADDSVVAAHLTALQKQAPETLDLYKSLGLATIAVAKKQGNLTEKSHAALLNKLK